MDLFAGSGAIGIEFLSRGCKKAYMCDKSHEAIKFVIANVKKTKLEENAIIINKDYTQFLKDAEKNGIKFDIIFLDPPYGQIKIEKLLNKIKELDILNDNGIVVCEYEFEKLDEIYGCLELIKDRKYGKTSLKIYKNRR